MAEAVPPTCELLADGRGDGGSFDQRCLADGLQVLHLGHAVVVDEVVVLLGRDECSVDLVAQVFDAHVLVVVRRHFGHQFGGVLPGRMEGREI